MNIKRMISNYIILFVIAFLVVVYPMLTIPNGHGTVGGFKDGVAFSHKYKMYGYPPWRYVYETPIPEWVPTWNGIALRWAIIYAVGLAAIIALVVGVLLSGWNSEFTPLDDSGDRGTWDD